MHTNTNSEKFGKSGDITYISILLTVALCIGVYLIISTVLIAKDGITFIEYAQNILSDPVNTMLNENQHPGYPFLIIAAHKITKTICDGLSPFSWIYSAQSIALIFRLLAIVSIYFIGKILVGSKFSFCATLILILLPAPAKLGSDALSDWPHIFFLATGLLLLIRGAVDKKWWLFGPAGLAAGAGYLIRPECAMMVVLGGLWLGLQLLWPKHIMSKGTALAALVLLLVGFLTIAGPYMKLKGAVFPKKNVGQLTHSSWQPEVHTENKQTVSEVTYTSQFIPSNIARAFVKLLGNIGETLMWFFVPALFVGIYSCLIKRAWYKPKQFFVIVLVALNIPLMIWLCTKYGYMSKRHTLPLMTFTIFYIPVGLQELAIWLRERFPKKGKLSVGINRNERTWFLVLFLIGVSICVPKLLRPIRAEKALYRVAAQWLNDHSTPDDLIATADSRINFYAGRRILEIEDLNSFAEAEYVVWIYKKGADEALPAGGGKVRAVFSKMDKSVKLVIYQCL